MPTGGLEKQMGRYASQPLRNRIGKAKATIKAGGEKGSEQVRKPLGSKKEKQNQS